MQKADKCKIVIIDDESYLFNEWKSLNRTCELQYFASFEEFFDQIDLKVIDLEEINLIITDFYFDNIDQGKTLLSENYIESLIEIYDYKSLLALASNGTSFRSPHINAIIEKKPIDLRILIKSLQQSEQKNFKM